MEKIGLLGRIKILSRPKGGILWKQAIRTIILMIIAGVLAQYLGLGVGVNVIMITTLFASLILDLPLPFKKVLYLGLLGAFITILAFLSVYLSSTSLPIFIFFTILWSFFTLSIYIFGETDGFVGFLFFSIYFLAAVLFHAQSTLIEWVIYPVFGYLVASILLIPKFLQRNKDIRKFVASTFSSHNSLRSTMVIRKSLEGISLKPYMYQLLRLGTYYTGFRGYSNMVISKLSSDSNNVFKKFLEITDKTGNNIVKNIVDKDKQVDLSEFDLELKKINDKSKSTGYSDLNAANTVANSIGTIFSSVNRLLKNDKMTSPDFKLPSTSSSLKQTLQANFNLKNMYMRHAIRFTIAMTIGLLIVHFTKNRDALWVVMGILIVLKPDVTSTVNNMLLRVSFNFVGVIIAIILGFIFPHFLLVWLAFLMIFLFRAFLPNYIGPSVMAMTIFIVLLWPYGTVMENGLARLVDIFIGATVALICAYALFPSRVTIDLPLQLSKTLETNCKYIKTVFVSPLNKYNHDKTVSSLKNFLLEHNNLESAIKKLQDSFVDVSDDVGLYNNITAVNYALTANVSAIASKLELKKYSGSDLSPLSNFVQKTMTNMVESIRENVEFEYVDEKDLKHLKKELSLNLEGHISDDTVQYLQWIISDMQLLTENMKNASESGLLSRYRRLL